MRLVFYIILIATFTVSCNEDGKEQKLPNPNEDCNSSTEGRLELNEEGNIVKNNYKLWYEKNKIKKNKIELVFESGRLIQRLIDQLDSDLTDQEVDNSMVQITKIVVHPTSQKIKKLKNKDYKEIQQLLTGRYKKCL